MPIETEPDLETTDEPEGLVDRYGDPLFAPTLPPQCGWLAPDGRFSPCIPWAHSESAQDLVRALGLVVSDPVEGATGALFAAGWVKIARPSRGDHRRLGGTFRFEHPDVACQGHEVRRASLTEAQAAVESAWMTLGAIHLDPPDGAAP